MQLTMAQACEYLAISRPTLYKYIRKGYVKPQRLPISSVDTNVWLSLSPQAQGIAKKQGFLLIIEQNDIQDLAEQLARRSQTVDQNDDIKRPFLTLVVASQKFGISVGALRNAITRGRLKVIFLSTQDAHNEGLINDPHIRKNVERRGGIMVTNAEAINTYLQSRPKI